MSDLLSRECDRLLEIFLQQGIERQQRHAELMAAFAKLDAALDDATQYAQRMVRIVPLTLSDDEGVPHPMPVNQHTGD